MTTYTNWTVGDVLRLCASVDDFCGAVNKGIFLDEINVDKSPNLCGIEGNTVGNCGLHIDNIGVTFKLVKSTGSTQDKNCSPTIVYKTIGEYRTDNNGVCATEYSVTEQDRLDYEDTGSSYKVMACITNNDGQTILGISNVTSSITISQAPSLEYNHTLQLYCRPWPWYGIGGASDYLISKIGDINGIMANFFTPVTGWQYVKTEFTTEGDDIVLNFRLNKTGSITLAQIGAVIGLLLVIIGLVGLFYIIKLIDNNPSPKPQESQPVQPKDSKPGVEDSNDTAKATCLSDLPTNPTCANIKSYATCLDAVHQGLYGTLKSIYANFPDFQVTYDKYFKIYKNLADTCDPNTPGKTPNDILNQFNGIITAYKKQLDDDFNKLQQKYDEETCFIPNPLGGCLLTKDTATTIVIMIVIVILVLIVLALLIRR